MKAIKIFENAKVVSVNNGEIWVEVNSEIQKYHNAALVSVNNGVVKIECDQPLTEDILQNGRVVEYRSGERRLVLKRPDGRALLVGVDSWADDPLSHRGSYEIVKVYEASFSGTLEQMCDGAHTLVWRK